MPIRCRTTKDLPVLEIGPAWGVLTQYLLEASYDLTVVELDMESVDYLEQNFPALEGRILAEDFLRLDLSKLFPRPVLCDRELSL